MFIGTAFIAMATFTIQLRFLEIGLAVFGTGFGIYSFGAFSIMAVMTTTAEAGAYLGMWTVVELLFKGGGTFLGGILLDVLASLTNSFSLTYGIIFTVETVGIVIAVVLLNKVDVIGWAKQTGRLTPQTQPLPLVIDL
jgi:BCD family chlorophyll transporter-like MFS transporter